MIVISDNVTQWLHTTIVLQQYVQIIIIKELCCNKYNHSRQFWPIWCTHLLLSHFRNLPHLFQKCYLCVIEMHCKRCNNMVGTGVGDRFKKQKYDILRSALSQGVWWRKCRKYMEYTHWIIIADMYYTQHNRSRNIYRSVYMEKHFSVCNMALISIYMEKQPQ